MFTKKVVPIDCTRPKKKVFILWGLIISVITAGLFFNFSSPVLADSLNSKKTILPVPIYQQQSSLSCEAAALRMALKYKGVAVSESKIMKYVGYDPTPHHGSIWGDPNVAFVGKINGRQPTTGYGVYWQPIARAGAKFRPTKAFTNGTIQLITREVIKGNPVVIWGYIGSGKRMDWTTPGGKKIIAIHGEHAMTVRGFIGSASNPTFIIYNDPLTGKMVTQSIQKFSRQWSALGNSGVIVR